MYYVIFWLVWVENILMIPFLVPTANLLFGTYNTYT
jgi:hypothetical protein